MPKATLTFDLPEEGNEFETAIKGAKYIGTLQEFDNFLRGKIKYAPEDMPEEAYKAFEECRDKLHELANDDGFSIWE